MNILSELVPGARQLRTPLAVGFLWLLVAWINAPRFPAHLQHSVLVSRVIKDASDLTPVLLIFAISFVAYLLGLIFEIFDEVIVKILAFALPFGFIIAIGFLLIALWPITLPMGVVIAGIAAWRRCRSKSFIAPELAQRLIGMSLPIYETTHSLWRLTQKVWVAARPETDKLVSEKVAELLDRNPDLKARFCDTLSLLRLRVACHVAGLHTGRVHMTTPDGKEVNISKAAARSSVDKDSESMLRLYLSQRLETSREISGEVALRVMRTNDVRDLVNRALETTETWLRSEKSNLFESCDRLISEGEFRRGATIPLAIALCSICSLYTTDMTYVLFPALPVFVLYFSGLRKLAEARAIVANCVAIGIAPIKLDISDTKLLSWPAQKQATNNRGRPSTLRLIWPIRPKAAEVPPTTEVA